MLKCYKVCKNNVLKVHNIMDSFICPDTEKCHLFSLKFTL